MRTPEWAVRAGLPSSTVRARDSWPFGPQGVELVGDGLVELELGDGVGLRRTDGRHRIEELDYDVLHASTRRVIPSLPTTLGLGAQRSPHIAQRLDQPANIFVGVHRRRREAQPFRALRHRRVDDRLYVDAVPTQQLF